MICSQLGYKSNVITEMGLPKNFLNTMEPKLMIENNYDFDAQHVWDNGTFSSNDLAINWFVIQGKETDLKFHYTITYNNSNVFFAHNVDATGTNTKISDKAMVQLKEINTLTKGKCFLLTPRIKAGKLYPALWLFMTTPPNE